MSKQKYSPFGVLHCLLGDFLAIWSRSEKAKADPHLLRGLDHFSAARRWRVATDPGKENVWLYYGGRAPGLFAPEVGEEENGNRRDDQNEHAHKEQVLGRQHPQIRLSASRERTQQMR